MSNINKETKDLNPTEGLSIEKLRLFDRKRGKVAIRNHITATLEILNTILEVNEVIDSYSSVEQQEIISKLNHDCEIFNSIHPANIFDFIKIEMEYKKKEIELHKTIASGLVDIAGEDLVGYTENNQWIMIKGSIKNFCTDIYQFLYENKNRNKKYHIIIDPATLRRVILSLFVDRFGNRLNTKTIEQYIPIKKTESQHTDNPVIKKQTKR